MNALEAPIDARDQRIRELEAGLAKAREELEVLRAKVPPNLEQLAKDARKRFLRFIVDRVNPGYQERHHGNLSSWTKALWREAGEIGLVGFNAPKVLGGEGQDLAAWNITLEELGKLSEDPGFLIIIQMQNNWAQMILASGRQDLIDRYAKRMVKGEIRLSWAIWEPADPPNLDSVARKVDGGWRITAHKPILTGGMHADVFAVAVREEASGEPALFLVEREDKGVEVTPLPTVGGHHLGYASLKIKDAFIPHDRLMLETDAVGEANSIYNNGVLNGNAVHLGWMQRIYGLCIDALRPKVRFGQRVLDLPHVQAELGRLHIGIELARSAFIRAIEKYRTSEPNPLGEPLTMMFKYFVAECALDTARTVMTLQGAAGYMDEQPWGRYLTHVACLVHASGAQDILPQQIGARMLVELEMRRLRRVGL